MHHQRYDPLLYQLDLTKENIALESAENALQRVDELKTQIEADGYVPIETLQEIKALCPESITVDLPIADYASTDKDVVYQKTTIALEFIGSAISLLFLGIFIGFVYKVYQFMKKMYDGFQELLNGKDSPVTKVKEAFQSAKAAMDLTGEFQRHCQNDPDTVKKLADELIRLTVNARQAQGLQGIKAPTMSGARLDACADQLFMSLTQGKISKLVHSLVTDDSANNPYKKFYDGYMTAMQERLAVATGKLAELTALFAARTEFDAKRFKIDDACFETAAKFLNLPVDSQARLDDEKARHLKDHITSVLQNKDSNLALRVENVYSVAYDYNRLSDLNENVIKEINRLGGSSKKLGDLNPKGMEETTYRKEATAYMTDYINATVTMSITAILIHRHLAEYTGLIKQASTQLLSAIVRLEAIIAQSEKLTDDEKVAVKATIQSYKKKYQDYDNGRASIV